ncbi:MAG TPA: CPBP family intramembrane glutamic endopeptidase [Gemmatimonadales bacterium]|nr:CPBP family intramembrane glutamic endopeptidase [Gemmatimonadales bacterium]
MRWTAAIGWSIAFFALSYLLAGVLGAFAALLAVGSFEAIPEWTRTPGAGAILIQGTAGLVAALVATWLIGVRINRLGRTALRYESGRRSAAGMGWGFVLGALAAATALVLAVIIGGAEWVRDSGGTVAYAREAGKTLLVLAPAALAEEVLFRGVPLVLLAAAFGRGPAVVGLAVVFGMAHLANPGITPLAVANIAAAGVFLGLAFYAPGGLFTAFGAHLGWNATLAALDAPVSGLPFSIPAIDYVAGGPVWLTGGAFGPEGGLTATTAIALACVATARWIRKELPA